VQGRRGELPVRPGKGVLLIKLARTTACSAFIASSGDAIC
jgi:hypothetical protein